MSQSPSHDRSQHPSTPSFLFGLTFLANENQDMRFLTKRGYEFGEVSSAMQKAIRRGDTRLAGYWALELWAAQIVFCKSSGGQAEGEMDGSMLR